MTNTLVRAAAVLLSLTFTCPSANAVLVVFSGFSDPDGHAVSATVDYTVNAGADTVAIKLTNTTPLTLDAGELFTGIDIDFGGLAASLNSATGVQRSVAADGTFTDTAPGQNLSWSVTGLVGGATGLYFTPTAKDAIIGPPTAGTYSLANNSIKGNNGHDPMAALSADFVLSVVGLEDSTPISISAFRYGTTLNVAVPEASSFMFGGVACALAGATWIRRRSRVTAA